VRPDLRVRQTVLVTLSGRALDDVDSLFHSLVADEAAPGVVYGVVDRTGLIHSGGHGVVRSGGPRPGAETAFRIASMTKSFTAAAVMSLVEEGVLGTADPVSRWVPEFGSVRLPTSDAPVPTVGMVMSMSAGLPKDDPWADRQESMSRAEFGRLLTAGVRFVSTPGTAFEYSNLGYALLGCVIEAAASMPYHEVVRRRFLEPLGLATTGFEAPAGDVATGYHRLDGRWEPQPVSRPGVFSAIGGLFSTVEDLARWVCWLADAFPARDGADDGPLRRATRREMQQAHRYVPPGRDGRPAGYGYGLVVEDDPDFGLVVSHGGGYPGFGSHMRWHARTGLGVVVCANGRYAPAEKKAAPALRALLKDADEPADVPFWPETIEARRAVERLLRGWDPEIVASWFSPNVDQDIPLDHRRKRLEHLVETVGPLGEPGDAVLRSDSPAHVVWPVGAANGRLRCEIRLTPEDPPRIQTLQVRAD
jgi:CubicO group peptidase (beta-lactamase class C family)